MTFFTRMGYPQGFEPSRPPPWSFSRIFKTHEGAIKAWLTRDHGHGPGNLKDANIAQFARMHDRVGTVKEVLGRLGEADRALVKKMLWKAAREVHTNVDPKLTSAPNVYTDERLGLHNQIISRILSTEAIAAATPPRGQAPDFVVLGGRGGSGKSQFTNTKDAGFVRVPGFDPSKYIHLDSDKIKEQLIPPYAGWNAAAVHDESAFVNESIKAECMALGLNIIDDVTMRSNSAEGHIKTAKKAGYTIQGLYMHLSPAEAAFRATKRFLTRKSDGTYGRLVPPSVVLGNKHNEKNFDAMKPYFKQWKAYDNSGPQGSTPVEIGHS